MKIMGAGLRELGGGGGVKKFGNFGKRAGDQEVNTQKEISASTRKSNIFYF